MVCSLDVALEEVRHTELLEQLGRDRCCGNPDGVEWRTILNHLKEGGTGARILPRQEKMTEPQVIGDRSVHDLELSALDLPGELLARQIEPSPGSLQQRQRGSPHRGSSRCRRRRRRRRRTPCASCLPRDGAKRLSRGSQRRSLLKVRACTAISQPHAISARGRR